MFARKSILTIDDFPECPEVEEDGMTFEENAVKKALTVARHTGLYGRSICCKCGDVVII